MRRPDMEFTCESLADAIADQILKRFNPGPRGPALVPVGISARHAHLSAEAVDALFGKGYELSFVRPLTQPGQFVTDDFIELVGPSGVALRLRVLGPTRRESQIEITRSDALRLGVPPTVRASGDLAGTPGGIIRTARAEIATERGVIVADRHLHLTGAEAAGFGLKDGDTVRVFVGGDKAGVMDNVKVRAGSGNAMDLHIDTDDANAFALAQGQTLAFERV